MKPEYDTAKHAAFQESMKDGLPFQTDFAETLEFCLDLAIAQEEISYARGTEMWERAAFYFKFIKKWIAANVHIKQLERELTWERMTVMERKDHWEENPYRERNHV